MKLFSIRGLPVYTDVATIIVSATIGMFATSVFSFSDPTLTLVESSTVAAGFVALLWISLLIHELAHAAAAAVWGIECIEVKLSIKGCYFFYRESTEWAAHLACAASGPISSVMMLFVAASAAGVVGWDNPKLMILSLAAMAFNFAFSLTSGIPYGDSDGAFILYCRRRLMEDSELGLNAGTHAVAIGPTVPAEHL